MKVFISWSGKASMTVAQTLHQTLPLMLQHVVPWTSFADIEPGERWASNIDFAMKRADFAIICVTPENLKSEWINFELGALEKSLGSSRICPYLIGFSPSDLTGPLVQFQAVEATEEGTWRLAEALNKIDDANRIERSRLHEAYKVWWPEFGEAVANAVAAVEAEKPDEVSADQVVEIPTDRELLEEILRKLASAPAHPARPEAVQEPEFVFLVHGRAVEKAESIARYVEKLGPKVVILQEQPNLGRTVIEKFEDHSTVTFAIVLMTGDDKGGLMSTPAEQLKPRARQNVVMELGYFLARLSRKLVVVLYEEGVELPSDYSGVLYIPLDASRAWRLILARELKAAGVTVDLNAAI